MGGSGLADVAVVGGGLVGSCVAYELVRLGANVTLVERESAGQATAAGAGILSAATSRWGSAADHAFAVDCGRYYQNLLDALQSDGSGAGRYAVCGTLVVDGPGDLDDVREEEFAFLMGRDSEVEGAQSRLRRLSSEEAHEVSPILGEVGSALFDPVGARVDGWDLCCDVRRAAQNRGLRMVFATVTDLLLHAGRVQGVEAGGERLGADAVVLAAGAWTKDFEAILGFETGVAPMRGQICHLQYRADVTSPPGRPSIVGLRGHYLVQWPDGRVVAGATRESGSGFEPVLTESGQSEVMAEALRLAPALEAAEVREWRVGLRPASKDGMPLLGRVSSLPGCYLATGHGAGGLLMGPYSARLVAEGVLAQGDPIQLGRYSPDRFGV